SPDGRQIAFSRAGLYRPYSMGGMTWDNYDLYVMNADGSHLRRQTRAQFYSLNAIHFSPDSHRLSFLATPHFHDFAGSGAVSGCYTMAVDSRDGLMPIPHPLGNVYDRLWSPDGHSAAWVFAPRNTYSWDIYLQPVNGPLSAPLGAFKNGTHIDGPVFSSHGSRLFYLQGDNADVSIAELWQLDTASLHRHRVADSKLFFDPLHWRQ
ncbi:MAG: hypothetical protein M3Y13_14030, partial [Armatimonadota bacterium]|nr:hypothetical protein [Armatimonadota bacterium]